MKTNLVKQLLFAVVLFLSLPLLSCSENYGGDYDVYETAYYLPILESMNMPRPEGSYIYPVVPSTDGWRKLSSYEAKVKVCQVPQNVLKKQSTQAVIQALWEYPLSLNFLAWNDYQEGYEFSYHNLNAYKELLRREDAARGLSERLMVVAENNLDFYFAHYILEMHLAQYAFMDQLSSVEKRAVAKRSLEILKVREEGGMSKITFFLLGRLMERDQYAPFMEASSDPEWRISFEYLMQVNAADYEIIIDMATRYASGN